MSSAGTAAAKKRVPLRLKDVETFLKKYKEAWETRNAELAASLFTRDARYQEDAFGEPIVGREAIHDYWKAATERQENIHFAVKTFVRTGYLLAAEWTCTYSSAAKGGRRELAGMFIADFYGHQVRSFREYWLSRTV